MKRNKTRLIGILSILISVGVIVISMLLQSVILLFMGIFLVVVSAVFAILLPALNVFREDRILNEEEIIKSGLHIVVCESCNKKNVLEDKYCVYCGDDLPKLDDERNITE